MIAVCEYSRYFKNTFVSIYNISNLKGYKNMSITSSVSGEQLRQFIEKIENLEIEKAEIQDHIKDVLSEAKAQGFDTKIMRQVIRMRKLKKEELIEQQELLDIYTHALGMVVEEAVA
jgi:uncharacterized protein (UPF0335 family)